MIGAISTQTLWYLTRATGIVTLLLLSATVALGIATYRRTDTQGLPRFAIAELHRRLSLISVVFLAIHIATAVSDPFAPIGWLAAVVPFAASYRRVWLGLGTVSVDLLLAVVATSLLRRWISQRLWRGAHWLAYLSWPVAVFHALGTGSDVRLSWFLLILAICVATVFISLLWRLSLLWPLRAGTKMLTAAGSAVVIVAGGVFAVSGPLKAGWALRAGTPVALLGSASSRSASSTGSATGASQAGAANTSSNLPTPPYTATLTGTLSTTAAASRQERIVIAATTSSPADGQLLVTLTGPPDGSGGVDVQESSASFGPTAVPGQYSGQVTAISGAAFSLTLADSTGSSLYLAVNLALQGSSVSGSLTASSVPGSNAAGGEGGGDDH
jgi:sulfoxide reductase heme-binding subunit YedZ